EKRANCPTNVWDAIREVRVALIDESSIGSLHLSERPQSHTGGVWHVAERAEGGNRLGAGCCIDWRVPVVVILRNVILGQEGCSVVLPTPRLCTGERGVVRVALISLQAFEHISSVEVVDPGTGITDRVRPCAVRPLMRVDELHRCPRCIAEFAITGNREDLCA